MHLTWVSFNNIRMVVMACMPIVIFYLIWLINTSENIRSDEGTLLDLVCWPDGNTIPVIIACGSVVAVVIELYGLYQLFKAGLSKREYNVTNGLFYYIWALIIIIIIFLAIVFYSALQSTIIRAKIKGGITKAMLRYASHLPSKVAIDRLQTRFHCCGRVNYQEWFFIPWFTPEQSTESVLTVRKFIADNVPYSCCSMDAMWPCIHHGVTKMGTIYKYDPSFQIVSADSSEGSRETNVKPVYHIPPNSGRIACVGGTQRRALKQLTIWEDGCEEKLIAEMMSVSWRFNSVMTLIIAAMISQIVAVRYIHTAYKNGLHIGNQITCEAYLLRSVTDTKLDVPKKKWFKRKFPTRTSQWATARYKRLDTTATSSPSNSSDELLKPIYE